MRRISIPEACVKEASSEADSGPFSATDVDDASNAAAFSSPKKDREVAGEVRSIRTSCLPPEAKSG